jgi:DNA-binding response OmpR family regulator
MKVLVVDDEPVRHDYVEFKDTGENVYFHAYNFREAEKFLNEEIFDLVRLDYNLKDPAGTGMDVALLITKLPVERRPKQVICHSLDAHRRQLMSEMLKKNNISAAAIEFG